MVGKCLDNLKHYLMYVFNDEIHENMNHANIKESVYFETNSLVKVYEIYC